MTYLSIDATINRLNEVLGSNWSTDAHTDVRDAKVPTRDGLKDGYLAVTQLHLTATIDGVEKSAYGVGVDRDLDPDKTAKTSLAEAIKKAAHQLGVGLYLWDETQRDAVERAMKLEKATPQALKAEVYRIAREKLGKDKPSQAEVAKLFKVKPGELGEAEVNRKILEAEGIL